MCVSATRGGGRALFGCFLRRPHVTPKLFLSALGESGRRALDAGLEARGWARSRGDRAAEAPGLDSGFSGTSWVPGAGVGAARSGGRLVPGSGLRRPSAFPPGAGGGGRGWA